MVFNTTFNNNYHSYIVAGSFIGGGNWSTKRKQPPCRKVERGVKHHKPSNSTIYYFNVFVEQKLQSITYYYCIDKQNMQKVAL
jgi:hypothetical protein